jgi:hypothetical protein
MATASDKESLTERFKRHTTPVQGNDCLLWLGATHHQTKVGVFQVAPGYNAPAARTAYVIAHAEPLAPNQRIEPTCATGKFCVNGAHWQQTPRPRRRPEASRSVRTERLWVSATQERGVGCSRRAASGISATFGSARPMLGNTTMGQALQPTRGSGTRCGWRTIPRRAAVALDRRPPSRTRKIAIASRRAWCVACSHGDQNGH